MMRHCLTLTALAAFSADPPAVRIVYYCEVDKTCLF